MALIKTQAEYLAAIAKLEKFLEAPTPPELGSLEAEELCDLLDAVEIYEKSSGNSSESGSNSN